MPATLIYGDALLSAALAEPADPLHRLAWADWCEEMGRDHLAEYARLQVLLEAARIDCLCGDCLRLLGRSGQHHNGRCQVRREHESLLERSRQLCVGSTPYPSPLDHWLEHGRTLVRLLPIGKVDITDRQPLVSRFRLFGRCEWRLDDHKWSAPAIDEPGHRQALLPAVLMTGLKMGRKNHTLSPSLPVWVEYDSIDTAVEDLSSTALRYAWGA